MIHVADVARFLEEFAPPVLAESWDNVGLLVGDGQREVARVMTCLTLTRESATEAIAGKANLIVTHHPLPFRPLARLTTATSEGRLLWELIGAGISIFSPHTAFDSARQGINQRLAYGLELTDIAPLVPAEDPGVGAGRHGRLTSPLRLNDLAARMKRLLAIEHVQAIGDLQRPIERVGVACGSAGEFLPLAKATGCDCLVTGELRFHACLEAEALDMTVVLAGHFASERFAVVELAGVLAGQFPKVEVWASQQEKDPLRWL